jgi:hypothetical protein
MVSEESSSNPNLNVKIKGMDEIMVVVLDVDDLIITWNNTRNNLRS